MRSIRILAILLGLFAATWATTSANAAFVSHKEAEMDAIYGQDSFGANPVDIRFLPTITHVDPNLLNINASWKWSALTSLFNSSTVHYAYYVDTIDWCGSFNTGIVGCGDRPGDDYAIESVYADSSNGAELMGHELAHNFNLTHVGNSSSNTNLMNPVVGRSPGPPQTTALTVTQANTILSRSSIQTDGAGKFIQVQPILILATAVPEPTSFVLALGLVGISTFVSRRRWH